MSPVLSEAHLRAKLAECDVPDYMHDGYVRYLLNGIVPGHFLTAILTNDLREACLRADETNARAIHDHVRFLYNHAPVGSWGSIDRVTEWIERHANERARA